MQGNEKFNFERLKNALDEFGLSMDLVPYSFEALLDLSINIQGHILKIFEFIAIKHGEGFTTKKEIISDMGYSREKVDEAINILKGARLIESFSRGREFPYMLTDLGAIMFLLIKTHEELFNTRDYWRKKEDENSD